MERKWRELFRAYAETPEHQARVCEAQNLIVAAFRRHGPGHCYTAFSGGKDSTALLHLVLSQPGGGRVMVWHWDYGPYYMPRWLEREIQENLQRIIEAAGVDVRVRVDTSPRYRHRGRSPANVFFPALFGRVIPVLYREGYRCVFMGIRAGEGVRRRLKTQRENAPHGILEVYPLKNWSWMDVWAYIVSHDLPYPSVYDCYARLLGWQNVRMATFFDPEFWKFGSENVDGVLMWRFRNADVRRKGYDHDASFEPS